MKGLTREDYFVFDLMDYINKAKGLYYKIPGDVRRFLKSLERYAKIMNDKDLSKNQLKRINLKAKEMLCELNFAYGYITVTFGEKTFSVFGV